VTLTQKQTAKSIDREAADWAARLDAGDLLPDEENTLRHWLAGDARRLGALARAQALMTSPEIAAALDTQRPRFVPSLSRRGFLAAAAASVAGAVFVIDRAEHGEVHDYASEIGEIRIIPLEDGSRITLNTDSRVSVEYREHSRLVRLVRGEAYFEVAKNPERPFIVSGPAAQARAVGTAYSVRLGDEDHMQVRVTSGRVAVEPPPSAWTESLRLSPIADNGAYLDANQQADVRVVRDGPFKGQVQVSIRDSTPDIFERELMWREGLLSFEGETLAEALDEFSRYSRQKVVLQGAVARERVSGLFSATDPAGFAKAIAIGLKLKLKKENDTIILYK
jgi:transmembrane sensor